jgi:hypothetical protein
MTLQKVPADESKTILRNWIRTTIDERQKVKVLCCYSNPLLISTLFCLSLRQAHAETIRSVDFFVAVLGSE